MGIIVAGVIIVGITVRVNIVGRPKRPGHRPADGRRVAAGWLADGHILSGGVAWQAGGQEAEKKTSKNPFSQAKFGE